MKNNKNINNKMIKRFYTKFKLKILCKIMNNKWIIRKK